MSPHLQKQQADDDQNPAMLWVDSGRALFARDCASCHVEGRSLTVKGLATRLPRVLSEGTGSAAGKVATLESQINACQSTRVAASPGAKNAAYPLESEPLLSLSAYVAFSSKSLGKIEDKDVVKSQAFQRGRAMFHAVQGKFDFSCAACHDKLPGKRVRTQAISQGHGVGFPAYRIEWQTLGSLNRRLRACFYGMEAAVPAASDPILADLELYLAWRSEGLPLEAPAVRR